MQGTLDLVPELPDVAIYIEALERRILGARLERVRLASPFLLRSFDPPLRTAEGRAVQGLRRLGKRIALALEGDLFQRIAIATASITAIAYRREGPTVLTVNSPAGDLGMLGMT